MSLQVTEDHSMNENCQGQPVFRIQGELCHRIGPLFPNENHPPTYAQLYFYDTHAALEYCCRQNLGLNSDTLRMLQNMLIDHHQYAHIYHHAYEILEHYDPDDNISISLCIPGNPSHNHRRYNLPTRDEVAVILPGVDGDVSQITQCDIVLQRHAGGLQNINDLHPTYVPLYYVLLFPYGEHGWHPGLKLCSSNDGTVGKCLTQTQYVAYRLQVRGNEYSSLLRGGRLLQCFVVDMFASIDQSHLLWF